MRDSIIKSAAKHTTKWYLNGQYQGFSVSTQVQEPKTSDVTKQIADTDNLNNTNSSSFKNEN
jgi:hypothetical protein